LAGGTAAVAFVAYGIIAFLQGQVQVVTFCFTAVGALLGFLWYNAHPAQVFMGGLRLAAAGSGAGDCRLHDRPVAAAGRRWPRVRGRGRIGRPAALLVQVHPQALWSRPSHFQIAPLHHHFEAIGWSETQVTMRFWLWAMMSGLLGVALALV
jgi:phospho-N-acetylmuramoyl-pentapeptide-transferase